MLQKWTDNAIAVVRIIIGVFMIYHGIEIFSEEKMKGYEKFLGDDLKMSNAVLLSYIGKAMELVAGVCLTLGFLTRPASLLMAAALALSSHYQKQPHEQIKDPVRRRRSRDGKDRERNTAKPGI